VLATSSPTGEEADAAEAALEAAVESVEADVARVSQPPRHTRLDERLFGAIGMASHGFGFLARGCRRRGG